jgi:hypothetical protein
VWEGLGDPAPHPLFVHLGDKEMSEIDLLIREGFVPLPLFYGTKQPLVKHGALRQTTPPALLRHLFCRTSLKTNTAIKVFAPMVILDFDNADLYHEWAETNPGLAITRTVKSARGFHCYFISEFGTENKISKSSGIDIKTDGYVVVPDSMHRSGVPYEYVRRCEPIPVMSMDDLGVEFQPERIYGGVQSDEISTVSAMFDLSGAIIEYSTSQYGDPKIHQERDYFMCRCPFHVDRRPSLGVWYDHYFCFSPYCEAHKRCDGVDFVVMKEKCGVREAMAIIQEMEEK